MPLGPGNGPAPFVPLRSEPCRALLFLLRANRTIRHLPGLVPFTFTLQIMCHKWAIRGRRLPWLRNAEWDVVRAACIVCLLSGR